MSTPRILKMGPTNCYLIKCSDGYLLVDTSLPEYFGRFLEELRRVNTDLSEIKYLLLTHQHDDHAGFAAELKEKTGCRIITHKDCVEALKKGSMIGTNRPLNRRVNITMWIYGKVKRRDFTFAPVTLDDKDITVTGDDDDTLRQIGIEGKIIYTPGHTTDSISVILANGDAFVGDACMNFLNFCGIHYRPVWLYDMKLVFDSWSKIIDNDARTIYPAHGKPFAIEELVHYKQKYAPI